MTDQTTVEQWAELGEAFRQARAAAQYEWCLVLAPETCEGLRHEMILQAPYTVILSRLVERFGQIMGWRIWNRWMCRRAGLRV